MKINRKQLEEIAHLARLKINSLELEKFENNFNEILSYVELLQKVKIPKESAQELPLEYTEVLAQDNIEQFELKDWHKNVHKKSDDYIAVKAIFNDEQR